MTISGNSDTATGWHTLPPGAVAQSLAVDPNTGLPSSTARTRLADDGPNALDGGVAPGRGDRTRTSVVKTVAHRTDAQAVGGGNGTMPVDEGRGYEETRAVRRARVLAECVWRRVAAAATHAEPSPGRRTTRWLTTS